MLLKQKHEERYDTAIGVMLSLAMVAGVWWYALKPWAKHTFIKPPSEDIALAPKACITPNPVPVTQHIAPVRPSTGDLAIAIVKPVAVPIKIVAKISITANKSVKPTPVALQSVRPTAPISTPVPEVINIIPPVVNVPASPPVIAVVEPEAPKVDVKIASPVLPPPVVEPIKDTPAPVIPPLEPGIVVRESFEFATASARLPASAVPKLLEIVRLLKDDKRLLKIVGYTDNVGDSLANQVLSLKRAKAVRRFLVNEGIPWAQLSVEGAGANNPIADNAHEEGRARNRRIEITE